MPRKRVLVDGYNLSLEKGTGIATYARNLTSNLGTLGHGVDVLYGLRIPSPKHPAAREMGFFNPYDKPYPKWRSLAKRAHFALTSASSRVARPVPSTGLVIDTQFRSRLPHFDRLLNVDGLFDDAQTLHRVLARPTSVRVPRESPDIAHWTCPLPIRLDRAKNVYTVHDLVPMRLPFTTLDHNQRFVELVRWIASTADHIVTVSETSRRDIINLLGVPADKVTNTYQAVEVPRPLLEKPREVVDEEVRGLFGLKPRGYFLFFGAIEPKKNVSRLIQGYLAAGLEEPLVIVGEEAWLAERELRFVSGDHSDHLSRFIQVEGVTQRERKIRRFGYAPFPLLISLIRGARAVVSPSLYEGFGLPALEAMVCGTPVITTREGASPEVVGDAALLVDPYDSTDIRSALVALASQPELAAGLTEKGRRRAAEFSPERYRARLQALYDRL
jgi:glycosyltransferase involved in cell wall biosynthesis